MKKIIITSVFALFCFSLIAQWDSPGVRSTSHGSTDYPQILGFGGALLELQESNQSPAGAANGLVFTVQNNNGIGSIIDAYLHYHTNFNQLMFSKTGNTNDAVFTVDADNGNTVIKGQTEIEFNSSGAAGSIEIVETEDDDFSRIFFRNTQDMSKRWALSGRLGSTTDDLFGLYYDGAPRLVYDEPSQDFEFNGKIDINSTLNTAIQVDDAQALWYNGDYFSWGFGGNYNFFADEVRIGNGSGEPAYQLEVVGDADITGELTAASDKRLKKNISEISMALSTVMSLEPKSYNFRVDEFQDMSLAEGEKFGFIAQELENVLPSLVSTGREVTDIKGQSFKSKSVNYIEIIPILTKAIQEQQELINHQNNELATYRSELNELRGMVSEIRSAMDQEHKKSVMSLDTEK